MLYPLLYQYFHCDLRKSFPTVGLVTVLLDGKVPDLFEPGIQKQNMSVLALLLLWGQTVKKAVPMVTTDFLGLGSGASKGNELPKWL